MKKILRLAALAAAMLFITVLLSACGNSGNTAESRCAHSWSAWTVDETQDIVCETGNIYIRTCGICGEQETTVQFIGHSYKTVEEKAPTCLENGHTEYSECERCGSIIGKEILYSSDSYHDIEIIPGYSAEYGKDGLSDGSVCRICDTLLEEQIVIPGTFAFSYEVDGGGNASVNVWTEDGIESGTAIRLYASSYSGTKFVGWFDGDTLVETSTGYVDYTMPSRHVTLTARFVPKDITLPELTIGEEYYRILVESGENGSVEQTCYVVKKGESVTVRATGEVGYAVNGWYVDDTLVGSKNTFEYTPDGSCTLRAEFGYGEFNVTVNASDKVTVEGLDSPYVFGENVSLTASVEEGYEFDGWYVDGELISTELNYVFTMPGTDVTVEARRKPVLPTSAELGSDDSVDVDLGSVDLVLTVYPSHAEFDSIIYEIISGADTTGAVINGGTLSYTSSGDVLIKATLLDADGNELLSTNVTVYIFSTHIGSVEIANGDNVVLAGESVAIDLLVYPPTAYPRDEYQFDLKANTCGATIKDGILTVTQPGSVRVRVRVDGSDWSDYFVFNVPTTVRTPEEFNAIRNNLGGYYILGADIDLSDYPEWQPIGYAENSDMGLTYGNAFKGYLNGNGHRITGLKIDVSKTDYLTVGLFGAIDNSARVIDLTVENYTVSGITHESIVYLGAIAGIANGKLTGLTVSGVFDTVGALYVGGAVGQLFGELSDSVITTRLTVGSFDTIRVGGAVGYYANGTFSDCTVTSNVEVLTGNGCYAGAVVGYAEGKISNVVLLESSMSVNVSQTSYVGLYVGYTSHSMLSGVHAVGSLSVHATSTIYVGGVAGYLVGAEDCSFDGSFIPERIHAGYIGNVFGYATGDISDISHGIDSIEISHTGTNLYYGSIAGYVGGNVSNVTCGMRSITVSSVKGSNPLYVGGIVGCALGKVESCEYRGNITVVTTNVATVGGIAGSAGSIDGCNAYSTVNVLGKTVKLGGIAGNVNGGARDTYFYGQIISVIDDSSSNGDCRVGGSFGYVKGGIENANNNVIISVTSPSAYVGGVVAYVDGDVVSVRADGKITVNAGMAYVGGIAGFASAAVKNSNAVSGITASASTGSLNVGGIVGYANGIIDGCYYSYGDIYATAAGQIYSGGIVGNATKTVKNSYTTYSHLLIDMSKQGSTAYIGGIAGCSSSNVSSSYSMCYVEGRADGKNKTIYIGGIVGYTTGKVSKCFTTSASGEYIREDMDEWDISTTVLNDSAVYVGGLIGYATSSSEVSDSYTVNSLYPRNSYAGGLIGFNAGKVLRSVAYSSISGTLGEKVGLFIGKSESTATYTDCFFLSTAANSNNAVGTGLAAGIEAKTESELRGTSVYHNFSKDAWNIDSGRRPTLKLDAEYWAKDSESGYYELISVIYPEDQHSYPIPESYVEISFDVGDGEEKVESIYIHDGEGIFITALPSRIGYKFAGWFFDRDYASPADSSIIYPDDDVILYAKWEAIPYDLTVSIDGRGEVSAKEQFICKETVTLTAYDRKGDYEFLGWFIDGTLVSEEKVYTFVAGAESVSIEAIFLDCYRLSVSTESESLGAVSFYDDDGKAAETRSFTMTAIASYGYTFVGWFDGDTLISRDGTLSYRMPSRDVSLVARFTALPTAGNEWDGSVAGSFFTGDGSEENPYIITNARELAYLAEKVNGGTTYEGAYFKLAADIYLGNREWTPIGRSKAFSGYLDGCGFTVYGGKITVSSSGYAYYGLIGYMLNGGVSNLAVDGFIIDITYGASTSYVGGIVGCADRSSTIVNCYANVNISAGYNTTYIGGIIGYSSAKISYCVSLGTVYAQSYSSGSIYCGGIVGYGQSGCIEECISFADVSAKSDYGYSYAHVGATVGNLPGEGYRYEGQTILRADEEQGVENGGTLVPVFTSAEDVYRFFALTAGYDLARWNLYVIKDTDLAPKLTASICRVFVSAENGTVDCTEAVTNAVTLTATPDRGYTFIGWYRNGRLISESPSFAYYVTVSGEVTPVFERTEYTLTVGSSYQNVGLEDMTETLYYLDTIVLSATEVEGYEFLGWFEGDELISEDLTFTYTMSDRSTAVTARFCRYYNVTVSTDGRGTAEGSTSAYETMTVTVKAEPVTGYTFFGWFDGNLCVSNEAEYTFAMPSRNYSIEARFTSATENFNETDVWGSNGASGFARGDGTLSSPYVITSAEELAYLATQTNSAKLPTGAYYVLAANIDLGNSVWTPIGNSDKPFKGHFDGNGYTVSNLTVQSGHKYSGLFGSVAEGASVSNVTVSGIKLYCYTGAYCCGSVVGLNFGRIENCSAIGKLNVSVSGNSSNVTNYYGGIAGYNGESGSIVGCSAVLDHTSYSSYAPSAIYAGGIVGCSKGVVSSCYSGGRVSYDSKAGRSLGGIVGCVEGGLVSDCYSNTDVGSTGGSSPYVGGVVGWASNGEIRNCFALGATYAGTSNTGSSVYVGGIVGYAVGASTVTNCFACGDVSSGAASSDVYVYVGGLIGYGTGVFNGYVLAGQKITVSVGTMKKSSEGTTVSYATASTAEFFTDTLGLSSDVWVIGEISLSEGKAPTLKFKSINEYRAIPGVSYYPITVDVAHIAGEGGSVNLYEYIVTGGTYVKLIATVPDGLEFVGWFVNGTLVSESTEYRYKPTRPSEIIAKFDYQRYTFSPIGEDGVTFSDYTERNYQDDEMTITATVAPGYRFDGWYAAQSSAYGYVAGTLLSNEYSFSFTMPASTYVIIAVTTPIDYYLNLETENAASGSVNGGCVCFNVGNTLTAEYTLTSGYRFVGWYLDGELVSSLRRYQFTAPASDITLVARTELIDYTLAVDSTAGGTVDTAGGVYTVVDEITVTATEARGYDFIGWYSNGKLISESKVYTFTMPARDYRLTATFTEAYVTLNVNPGFNGTAEGSTTVRKDSTATVKATPDEGYRFGGWYINGTLVSEETEYTAEYNVSGDYNVYASFVPEGINVTYYSDGEQVVKEEIDDQASYLTPYLYKEGYRFDGWYTDNVTFATPLNVASLTQNTDAFAKWTQLTTVNEVYSELPVTHTVEVYSRLSSTEAIKDHIVLKNHLGEDVPVTVAPSGRPGYYYVGAEFAEGATYTFVLEGDEVFVTDGIAYFVLVFERAEVEEVDYASEVITFGVKDIKYKRPGNGGLTLVYKGDIRVGDVLYCTNDPDGCLGYAESVTLIADNTYDVIFSPTPVDPTLILSRLNVNQKDVDLGLEDAEIEGNVDEALAIFAEYAKQASRVDSLCGDLAALAAKDRSFSFGEPKVEPTLKVKGNMIEIGVTITIAGERKNAEGKVVDKFSVRVQVGIINTLSTKCDVDVSVVRMAIDNFYFELANRTEVYFNVDLVYGSGDSDANFDALELLLINYKETISENKELPFDLESQCEKTFEALKIPISIPIGSTCLVVDITITPFIRYNVIGQLDVNTSFAVTNTCALVYVGGGFDICYNCDTERTVEIYALAYCRLEAGINVKASLYISGLKSLLEAFVFFEAGPYVEAAGALMYKDDKLDLAGYVEWGYFYDWGVGVNVIGKTFAYDPDKVSKRLGYIGTYYLYIEFTENNEKYTVDEYTIEIFEEFDHELYAFDLNTFAPVTTVGERDDYRYVIEENPYVYVDAFDYLRIKVVPSAPVTLDLYIYIGNMAVKTVTLTLDIDEYHVSAAQSNYGYVQIDKSTAAVGQSVSFRFVRNDERVVVRYWTVNGVKVDKPYLNLTVPMVEGGLNVEVYAEKLTADVYYVDSVEDFRLLEIYPDAIFIQTADIDFENKIMLPIHEFRGTYYGNGFKLKNVNVTNYNTGEVSYIGLIGKATKATFYGMRIEKMSAGSYTGYETRNHTVYFGGIVGYGSEVAFYDCTVTDLNASMTFSGSAYLLAYAKKLYTRMGGICGSTSTSVIMDSCSVVNTDFKSYIKSTAGAGSIGSPVEENVVGGLIGATFNKVSIKDCYVQASFDIDNSWSGTSRLYMGGLVGAMADIRTTTKIYPVSIKNCLTDFTVNQTNNSNKIFVSAAVGDYAKNTSDYDVNSHADKLFTVSDTYATSTSVWDARVNAYEKSAIYTDDFIYNILGFDPMMWNVIDGKLVKR